ncbi:hypothetical protein, partial [Thiolapillus sp.]|uniref:hypothetical protein n=1 Tax=Thiolapillus sp. TaxID=2017437 RepID=UPI003AF436FD
PRSEAYFVFPLAQGTPGKQCGLAATGVYQPSLRSPWLAALVESGALFAVLPVDRLDFCTKRFVRLGIQQLPGETGTPH